MAKHEISCKKSVLIGALTAEQ